MRGSEGPEHGGWIPKDWEHRGNRGKGFVLFALNAELQAESGTQSIDNKHS